MQYYRRNLGDYAKKAGRLNMLQHGSYTLLIDACYDREKFPTMDEAIEWAWASNPDEVRAVEFVLSKFFTLENGVYVQKRIAEELSEYAEFCAEQKRKGLLGGRPKNPTGINNNPTGLENNPPVTRTKPDETLTTNHYPLTTKKPKPLSKEKPLDEFAIFWQAYPRKEAKADAMKAWVSPKIKIDLAVILKAIEAKKATGDWFETQYIPLPASWLRGARWNDEILPPSAKTKLSTVVPTQARTCTHCKEPAHMEISGRWYCRNHDQYSTSEAA